MKKRRGRLLIWIAVVIIAVFVILFLTRKKGGEERRSVRVTRANILEKALAVGSIEPLHEIAVKSKNSGIVGRLFINVGEFVNEGEPLLEVKPNPTPIELAQAKRNVEMKAISLETLAKELKRNEALREKDLISDYELEMMKREFDEAELNFKMAGEELDLLEKGKIRIADSNIETVIRSPITGYVLEKSVDVGDPVVPLTSYQAGTELLKMADMEDLLFKGTVDEIDVGKIKEEMKAELQIGALPGKKVTGRVSLISLKARKEENTTVFPIEIVIEDVGEAVLRAGFSANANIIIARKDSVLSIPERVVTFRNDSAFVRVPAGEKESREIPVQTGLSDAITVEIVSGLELGQEVLEQELKQIQ